MVLYNPIQPKFADLDTQKNPVSIKNTGTHIIEQTDWRKMSTLNNNPKERIFAFDAAKAIGIFL